MNSGKLTNPDPDGSVFDDVKFCDFKLPEVLVPKVTVMYTADEQKFFVCWAIMIN